MEEEVSEPLQGLSFPAGPSLARYFGSFQENAEGRERDFWYGSGTIFPFFFFWEDSALALQGSTAALAWPCVASVWCNVLVGSQCALVFLSLSLSPPCLFLDGEGVCFHPESCCLRTVTNSVLVSYFSPFLSFLFSYVFNACRLQSSPLYHGQGRDQDRKRVELSLFIPLKLFLCLATTTIHLFFFSLSPNTHKKKEQSNADWWPCVCVCVHFVTLGSGAVT